MEAKLKEVADRTMEPTCESKATIPNPPTDSVSDTEIEHNRAMIGGQTTGPLENIIDVLEFCRANDLPARVVGRWVWIAFESKPDQEVRNLLKSAGFRWSPRRGQWAHNCGQSSKPASGYRPWDKYRTVSLDEALATV